MRLMHPLLRPVSGGGSLVLAVGLLSAVAPPAPAAEEDPGRIQLEPERASQVRAAEIPVDAGLPGVAQRRSGPEGRTTGRLDTERFAQVAVTWTGASSPGVHVRTRTSGEWSGWRDLAPLGDGPSGAEARAADRHGTQLLWVGRSDGVQVRTTGPARDVRLVLIDPGEQGSGGAQPAAAENTPTGGFSAAPAVATTTPTTVPTARKRPNRAPRPRLFSRRDWGANNSWAWRGGDRPRVDRRLKQVHLHHTASANGYSRRQVPGMIRGMYRYHTKSLGWSDIGYNFLVDRFGRIWVGRWSSVHRLVRGAHTLGFNHKSLGVAVIGNYQRARASLRVRRQLARIIAWRLDWHGGRSIGKVPIRSTGSDRYPRGTKLRLPRVDGHRDTNYTACPGRHLYRELPWLRKVSQRRMNRF